MAFVENPTPLHDKNYGEARDEGSILQQQQQKVTYDRQITP